MLENTDFSAGDQGLPAENAGCGSPHLAGKIITPATRDRLFYFAWTFEMSPPGSVFDILDDEMEVFAASVPRDRFWAELEGAPRPPAYIRRPLAYAGGVATYGAGQISLGHLLPGCLEIYETLLRDAGYRVAEEAPEPESLLAPEPDALLPLSNGEGLRPNGYDEPLRVVSWRMPD